MRLSTPITNAARVFRYYQAGIVNTLFGYGLYVALVWLGMSPFPAQLAAHVTGVAFNYFTYSRVAFPDAKAAKVRFVIFYIVTYLLSAGLLAIALQFFSSPYIAGLAAAVVASVINYFVLRQFVFLSPVAKA
jgi:putative flippase GtrA